MSESPKTLEHIALMSTICGGINGEDRQSCSTPYKYVRRALLPTISDVHQNLVRYHSVRITKGFQGVMDVIYFQGPSL